MTLKAVPLDQVGHIGEVSVFRQFRQRRPDDPGPRDADVDLAVGFAHSVERPRHKGVVLDGVAEDDQLGRADAVPVGGQFGRPLDHPPIISTASILMPARVEPTLTDEQRWSVTVSASGIDSISSLSPAEKPFWTRAE